MNKENIERVKFDDRGLVPAIVQDEKTGQVLMMAWMNAQSLRLSIETGYTHFWSRSRQKLWKKGEISGNVQNIKALFYDCDADTLLVTVDQRGPACHTGRRSCFFRSLTTAAGDYDALEFDEPLTVLKELAGVIADRKDNAVKGSYTSRLFAGGQEMISAKVLEESREVVEAYEEKGEDQLIYEAADLLFHLMVLLSSRGLDIEEVARELTRRRGNAPKKEQAP